MNGFEVNGFEGANLGELVGNEATIEVDERLMAKRLESAIAWANNGGLVLPVHRGTKAGYPKWDQLATDDIGTVIAWSARYAGCNFGFLMGNPFVCLDVDVRDGKPGMESLAILAAKYAVPLDTTYSVVTPSGGRHYYFRTSRSYGTKSGALPGIDFRGRKSYILSPYSELQDEGHYHPVGSFDKILELPEDLGDLLSGESAKRSSVFAAGWTAAPMPRSESAEGLSNESLPASDRGLIQHWLKSIDSSLPYDAWYRLIFAFLNIWPTTETVELLEDWSRQSHKWDEAEFRKKVKSYNPNHPEKLGRRFILQTIDDYPSDTVPDPLKCEGIEDAALQRFVDAHVEETNRLLRAYGNNPTKEHEKALRAIGETMIRALYSPTSFRRAFPLETGMGKTTLVKALCVVLSKEGIDKSILITCEQIKQLGELRDDLIAIGVPEDRIGVVHSNTGEEDVPSIDRSRAPYYQFLLACHNGIRTERGRRADPEDLMRYTPRSGNPGRRDLVIWDESLIDAKAYHISKTDLLDSIAVCLSRYETALAEGKPTAGWEHVYEGLKRLLEDAEAKLRATLDGVVDLPPFDIKASTMRQAIGNLLYRNGVNHADTLHERVLCQFLDFSRRGTVRVAQLRGDKAMIQFEQTIDVCFNKIVVLDASCHIRELAKYDPKLEINRLPITKRYSNVRIRWVDGKASKTAFRADGGGANFAAFSDYFLHLIERDYRREDEGIVYYHKENEARVHAVLNRAREIRGLGAGTIHALHWGMHRASNKYRNAKWTFMWGLQYLPEGAIAGLIAGQMGQADHVFLRNEINDVRNSEVAESLYQAISRGHSRLTVDGEAGTQTVDLVVPAAQWGQLLPLLDRVMPGLKTAHIQSPHFPERMRKNAASYLDLAEAILSVLASLPPSVIEIPIGRVIELLPFEVNTNSSRWKSAQKTVDARLKGWTRRKRTLVRGT